MTNLSCCDAGLSFVTERRWFFNDKTIQIYVTVSHCIIVIGIDKWARSRGHKESIANLAFINHN